MHGRLVGSIVAAMTALVLAPVEASADPTVVRLEVRDADTGDRLAEGARITDTVTLDVHAESSTGLRRVRVEAHPVTEEKWYCVAEVDTRDDGISVDVEMAWDTHRWPAPESGSGCTHTLPHIHGSPTPNTDLEMRAVAIDLVDDQKTLNGSAFPFALANPAAAPAWAGDPSVASGTRAVALSWIPGSEPDLVEYLISRTGPDGSVVERRIDATTPERDRCSRVGGSAIRCSDALPDDGGRYAYKLAALRPGGAQRCAARATCVASPFSEARFVEVATAGGGSPAPSLTFTPAPASTSANPSSPASIDPSPIPSTDGSVTAAPAGDASGGSSAPMLVAIALLLAAGVIVGMRMRRQRMDRSG